MQTIPHRDRAAVLHAHPTHFIEAVKLLEQLLPALHAASDGRKVLLQGLIAPALADQLAAWGADLDDIEADADLEQDPDDEAE